MKKDFLKELSNSTFIDNNDGDIQPIAHRHFNDEMIDAFVAIDEANSGIVLNIDILTGGDEVAAKAEVWKYVSAAIADPTTQLTLVSRSSMFILDSYGVDHNSYFLKLVMWFMLESPSENPANCCASILDISGEYTKTGITTYSISMNSVTIPNVFNAAGTSDIDVMSQRAVTEALGAKASKDVATILHDGLMSKKNVVDLAAVVLHSYTSHAGRIAIDNDDGNTIVTKIKGTFTVERETNPAFGDSSYFVEGYTYKITHNCNGSYIPHVNLERSVYPGQPLSVNAYDIQPNYFKVAFTGHTGVNNSFTDVNGYPVFFNFTVERF